MTNTQDFLVRIGACREAREWVGERTLARAWRECTRVDWLKWLLHVPIWAEYLAKRAPIWAEYDAKCATIWAEYDAKCATIDACRTCDEVRERFACPSEVV